MRVACRRFLPVWRQKIGAIGAEKRQKEAEFGGGGGSVGKMSASITFLD
jgi:hypothetical protein